MDNSNIISTTAVLGLDIFKDIKEIENSVFLDYFQLPAQSAASSTDD